MVTTPDGKKLVTLIPGDGIGPECVESARKIVEASGAKVAWEIRHAGESVFKQGIASGVPTPAFSTALSFYDGYRSGWLPANLLQAQRDYFGAHTYERIDRPRGQFFHTNWTGRGGRTSSGTYNV